MSTNTLPRIQLSKSQRRMLKHRTQKLVDEVNTPVGLPKQLRQVNLRRKTRQIGEAVFGEAKLRQMKRAIFFATGSMAVIVEGLPVPPDNDFERDPNEVTLAEGIAAVLGQTVGSTFGYWEEADGLLYQLLQPKEGGEQGNHGLSRGDFGTHMDNSFLKRQAQPEAIVLYGWVNEAQAETRVYPLEPNLQLLTKRYGREALELLGHAAFVCPMSESFRGEDVDVNDVFTKPRPIVVWDEQRLYWRWQGNTYNVEVDSRMSDPAAYRDAYENLKTVFNGCGVSEPVVIQPGMAVIFNQIRTGHSARTDPIW